MKGKTVLIILPLILLAIAIPVAVFFIGKGGSTDMRSKAAPATHISLSTLATSVALNQEFEVNIVVDTSNNSIAQIRPVIKIDTTKLSYISANPGPFLPGAAEGDKTFNAATGTLTYYLYSTTSQSGTGTVASIRLKAIALGTTTISFDTQTAAGAIGEVDPTTQQTLNVIVPPMNPLTMTIIGTGSSVTDTQSPSPTETIEPTVEPTTGPVTTTTETPIPTDTLESEPTAEETPPPISPSSEITQEDGAVFQTQLPTLTGTGTAGATVTIVIHSDETITGAVTVNEDGTWSFTPDTPLSPGEHTATITITNPDGTTATQTITFTVESQETPITGNTLPLAFSMTIGTLFLLTGFWLRKSSSSY